MTSEVNTHRYGGDNGVIPDDTAAHERNHERQ